MKLKLATLMAATLEMGLMANKFVEENEITITRTCNTDMWKPSGKTFGKVNGKRKRNPNRWR